MNERNKRLALFSVLIQEALKNDLQIKANELIIEKTIYILSEKLSLEHWQEFRSAEYWKIYDSLEEKPRRLFVLEELKKIILKYNL